MVVTARATQKIMDTSTKTGQMVQIITLSMLVIMVEMFQRIRGEMAGVGRARKEVKTIISLLIFQALVSFVAAGDRQQRY